MLFRKVLSASEKEEIAISGVRTFDKYNPALLSYYSIVGNDILSGTQAETDWFELKSLTNPTWTNTGSIFIPWTDFNYMSACPHGYRMHSDYTNSNK